MIRGMASSSLQDSFVQLKERPRISPKLCFKVSFLVYSFPNAFKTCFQYSAFIQGSLIKEQNWVQSFCLSSSYPSISSLLSSCTSSLLFMKAVDTLSILLIKRCPLVAAMALLASSWLVNLTKPYPFDSLVAVSVMILALKAEGYLLLKCSSNLYQVAKGSISPMYICIQLWPVLAWLGTAGRLLPPYAAQLSLNCLLVLGMVRLLWLMQKLLAALWLKNQRNPYLRGRPLVLSFISFIAASYLEQPREVRRECRKDSSIQESRSPIHRVLDFSLGLDSICK